MAMAVEMSVAVALTISAATAAAISVAMAVITDIDTWHDFVYGSVFSGGVGELTGCEWYPRVESGCWDIT